MAAERTPTGVERTSRPKRIPLGTRNVLNAPKREGYVRRFVNNDDGRVEAFEAAGYSVVRGNVQVGDPKAGQATPTGSVVEKPVGLGTKAVLMEIKQEWYDEDQRTKSKNVNESEQDMKRQLNKRQSGSYGEVSIE